MKQPAVLTASAIILAVMVFAFQGVQSRVVIPTFPVLSANFSDDMPHGQPAVNYIEFMSNNLYSRFPYSYQELWAANWIMEELLAMGHSDVEMQNFYREDLRGLWPMPIMSLVYILDSSPFINFGLRADRASQNVVLTVPGQSDEVIVVGAHYDSVLYPGASDNASGVALILESAMRMINADNYYTIKYIFFGSEEVGLYGVLNYVF